MNIGLTSTVSQVLSKLTYTLYLQTDATASQTICEDHFDDCCHQCHGTKGRLLPAAVSGLTGKIGIYVYSIYKY